MNTDLKFPKYDGKDCHSGIVVTSRDLKYRKEPDTMAIKLLVVVGHPQASDKLEVKIQKSSALMRHHGGRSKTYPDPEWIC